MDENIRVRVREKRGELRGNKMEQDECDRFRFERFVFRKCFPLIMSKRMLAKIMPAKRVIG